MDRISYHFSSVPKQEQVARLMLKLGISVKSGDAYCGPIKQADAAVARALDIDRRVVRCTIERIMSTPELYALFSKIKPTLLIDEAASEIGCSAIEIVPVDSQVPGLMANILGVLSREMINIRQAVVIDSQESNVSHLIIVADGTIPGDLLAEIRSIGGVASVIIK